MLTIEPRLFSTIPGRKARRVRCMGLTLRSNEKSQSCSLQSSTVPGCTKPAQLTRMSGGPNAFITSCASAATAAVERTSSCSRRAQERLASFPASRSVAITRAPSAPNASQMARPMPCPAAVTNAILSARRWVMGSSPQVDHLPLEGGGRTASAVREGVTALPHTLRWCHALRRCHPTPDCLRQSDPPPAGEGRGTSIIIARHTEGLGDALVLHGRLKHHAVGELVHHGALDFLPRRLALGKLEAAAILQGKPALREFGLRNQDVGRTLVKIDADAVTRAEQRK